ncbi:MAG: argininosuccinate lyase [Bacteroidetes bacterium]|nr:argininosuccinate lyase [Bacteroidota bacterium]
MKIWQKKSTSIPEFIESFTVGRDCEFDTLLAEWDVLGSLAHTQMLESIGLLTSDEFSEIRRELISIYQDIKQGKFKIDEHSEDIHSYIEAILTERIGDSGKKIHSGRSRNDQVLVDVKLFLRNEILTVVRLVDDLFKQLQYLSEIHKNHLLPGYTHLQLAMPSSFGLWFGAYAESLVDDMELLLASFRVVNKNPLGSGAGFGSSFPLNRTLTTKLLGFAELNYNVVYAQMTRGKTEKIVAMAVSSIASTLGKISMDICLYMNQQFGFISFADELTTGSSIMPHKKNPDVFELIRGKCNRLQALPNELALLTSNLPSGYHRELQLTKEILFPMIKEIKQCLEIGTFMLQNIKVTTNILENEKYSSLFSVEAVNQETLNGLPFREAYRKIGLQIENNTFIPPTSLHHTHEGSIGNLCNDKIANMMKKLVLQFDQLEFQKVLDSLIQII